MVLPVALLASVLLSACFAQFDLRECTNKSCVFYPTNCEENGSCEKIVSFVPNSDGWVVIELFFNGTHSNTNYIAIGSSNDDQMGDDAVTHCGFDKNNKVGVFLSRNVGKSNVPIELTDENIAQYVVLLQASQTPTSIYCKYQQKISPDASAQKMYVPNLNRSYHLLLAYGNTNNYKVLGIHSLDGNSKDFPSFIATPVNFGSEKSTETAPAKLKLRPKRIFILVHGMIMLLGWMWLVASAVAAARYLRNHWPNTTPFGLKIWFHIHRTMNILAVFLVAVAVLLAFIGKDWRWTGPSTGRSSVQNLTPGALHSLIGAISSGIMLTQFVGGLLRCDHGSKLRPIFNWSHRICGILAYSLALVSILLAVIYFRVWVARWAAILVFFGYLAVLTLTIIAAQKANSLEKHRNSSITYEMGGQQYYGEQINVVTRSHKSNKGERVTALTVIIFIALAALFAILMVLLIIFSQ